MTIRSVAISGNSEPRVHSSALAVLGLLVAVWGCTSEES